MQRNINEWGHRIFHAEDAVELLFRGYEIDKIAISNDADLAQYNKTCIDHDKTDYVIAGYSPPEWSPQEDALRRQQSWMMPEDYQTLDVRQKLLDLCKTSAQTERVQHEMDLFEQRGLLPVLRLMCYLVDHWRNNNVLWGVGRGSSVASYCLFLIGVHRCDSMQYQLDVAEFLR